MWHIETGSYILVKDGVKSTLGNVGVESHKNDTSDMNATIAGFCVVQQDGTESLRALLVGMVLPLEVLYDMLLRLLNELVDIGIGIVSQLAQIPTNFSLFSDARNGPDAAPSTRPSAK